MFRQVHDMANPAAVQAMIAEAWYRGHNIGDQLHPIPGYHAKALWVLVTYPVVFHTARLLLSAGTPIGRYWNLTTGFHGIEPDSSHDAVQDLRLAIARLYRNEQGRGQFCTVDQYDRNGCLYLFVYLDDYTQTHVGHNERGNLIRYPLRPAFEVVFVYNTVRGSLDMFAHGDRRWRANLLDLFCQHILYSPVPATATARRPYQLNDLIDRSFRLPIDPLGGVRQARISRMRVAMRNSPRRVTLEADPDAGAADIYDMLDTHFPLDLFPRADLYVNQVTFHVVYRTRDDERDHPLTFEVSFPDGCNLKSMSDERRAIGERCLRRWGILNDEPADGTAPTDRVA
jgi:hypothetical protein